MPGYREGCYEVTVTWRRPPQKRGVVDAKNCMRIQYAALAIELMSKAHTSGIALSNRSNMNSFWAQKQRVHRPDW